VRILACIFCLFAGIVILISGYLPYLQDNILNDVSWGLYDRAFWSNLLVNTNSSLLDTLIIGILVLWLDTRRETKEHIRDRLDAISDLRYYRESDGPYRIHAHVKKLSELKFYELDLHDCVMDKLKLEKIKFLNANLHGIHLKDATLKLCNFTNVAAQGASLERLKQNGCIIEDSDFSRANFSSAVLTGLTFKNTRLERTNFESASLDSVIFHNVNLKNARFCGASLRSANLRGCTNLTATQLAQADNVDYIILDDALLNDLKRLVPHMKISRNR
jgi:uncharacterized protein YjbI with pentapeptide repeats